ncbi:hypothetical protein Tco_1298635 [Tanacetum coccineum]
MARPAEFNAKNNRLNKKKGNKRLEPKDDFKFMCNRTGCGYGFNHFHDLQAHKANCKKNLSNKQVADNAALQQPGPAAVQVLLVSDYSGLMVCYDDETKRRPTDEHSCFKEARSDAHSPF